MIQGLSNIAAGATIGSNHNSRANDGEIRAGRGFWPGLAVTVKHSSRFASFVLLAKGDYPSELDIRFPFAMVSNNILKDRLEVMPAYFWMYNLFALERNAWKSARRDKRHIKRQHIEMDYLAPDTAEEIISAAAFLETRLAEAGLSGDEKAEPHIAEIPVRGLERNKRETVILKPRRALAAYRRMLRFYAVKTLALVLDSRPETGFADLPAILGGADPEDRVRDWVNAGGQIVPAFRVDRLRAEIREGVINTWEAIHAAYDQWFAEYPLDKARHAWAVLAGIRSSAAEIPGHGAACTGKAAIIGAGEFKKELETAWETRKWITGQVYITRAKDFKDPFRIVTYRNRTEMEKVAGKLEDNPFIQLVREEEQGFGNIIKKLAAGL
jgi:hypothetical protein